MHSLLIEERNRIIVTEVADIDSFDEETILMSLLTGGLMLKGQGLQIQKLDVEEGKAVIAGTVNSVTYTAKKDKSDSGFLKKLLK